MGKGGGRALNLGRLEPVINLKLTALSDSAYERHSPDYPSHPILKEWTGILVCTPEPLLFMASKERNGMEGGGNFRLG